MARGRGTDSGGAHIAGHRTLRVAGSVTFRCRLRSHRTQREAGPFGVPPPSSPRSHGGVGTPASCQALFWFCECILRMWALSSARWPDDPHAGPMTCTWAPPPRRMSRGLRAYQRVNAHVQGFACEQRAEIDTESANVQTHCLKLTDFRLFSPNGSAVWRAHRFTSQPHRHQTGGIALHEAPTRR